MGPTSGLKIGFLPFSQIWLFGSLVFLEIAYSGSLQQCLPFSWVKTHEKFVEAQICAKRAILN